jgi:5-methylcytosine-specific restriction endonuclease McrA
VWAAELTHRGEQIKRAMERRRVLRRSRRQRKTWYRKPPRFTNRSVRRLRCLCPIMAISQELVRFDTQAMDTPAIAGVEYQQGQLAGYEVKEYALLTWNHQCAYCDAREVPLELDHIHPRSKHGSNRVSNLTLACRLCNQRKGNQGIHAFLRDEPERLARILSQLKAPRRDVAAVNATRWALYERLTALGLPVECGSGGLTKYNRVSRGLPKTHWCDAACVGRSTPQTLDVGGIVPLQITATGHGSRQMCRMDKYGFPRTGPKQHKCVQGFQTGDLVRALVPAGRKAGTYVGRVAVRTSGSFNIATSQGTVQGITYRFCRLIARADGYSH